MKRFWIVLAGVALTSALMMGSMSSAVAQVSGSQGRSSDNYTCTTSASNPDGICVCRTPFACHSMIMDRVCRGTFRKSVEQTECLPGRNECSCEWNGVTGRVDVDHREAESDAPRRNETVPARRGSPRNETVPARRGTFAAPSDLALGDVQRTSLTMIWRDNTPFEHGISVERGTPTRERGGTNYHWEHVFNVEERVESRAEGTGLRSDDDDDLQPDTQYCYRVRAYRDETFSDYSETVCARTLP